MISQLSDWFPRPMIWAIIVKFDQIRKNMVDRSSHDRSTISATATSKFTTTTASPAEQLIADIVTLFVRSKL